MKHPEPVFGGGAGEPLLTQKWSPRKYSPFLVFGRVREGAFDAKASSRKNPVLPSPRSFPRSLTTAFCGR